MSQYEEYTVSAEIQLPNSHFQFKQLAPTWTVVSLIKKEKKNKIRAGRRWAWGQVHSSSLPPQQQESCFHSSLCSLPPWKLPPRLQTIRWLCGPSTPTFFLRIVELRGHEGEWETGYCISFIDRLFSFVRQLDLPHFLDPPDLMLIVCQFTVLFTSNHAVFFYKNILLDRFY